MISYDVRGIVSTSDFTLSHFTAVQGSCRVHTVEDYRVYFAIIIPVLISVLYRSLLRYNSWTVNACQLLGQVLMFVILEVSKVYLSI